MWEINCSQYLARLKHVENVPCSLQSRMQDRWVLPNPWLQKCESLLQCHIGEQFLSVLHHRSFLDACNPNPVPKTQAFHQQLQYCHIIFKNLQQTACTNVFRNRSREAIDKCRKHTEGRTITYREGSYRKAHTNWVPKIERAPEAIFLCNIRL